MLPRIGLALFTAVLVALALPAAGHAVTISVNEQTDANDIANNDGTCDTDAAAGAQCTLRAAVQTVNDSTLPGSDDIFLHATDYTLSLNSALSIDSEVRIFGEDARTTRIIAGANSRVLDVTGGPALLQRLTVRGGVVANDPGGGIRHNSTQSLRLDEVIVRDNTLNTDNVTTGGGGIAQMGTGALTVLGSTVRDNAVNVTDTADAFGTSATGGGIDATAAAGTLTIENSTIDNNRVTGANDNASAFGGGLATARATTLTNVTFAGNFVGKFGTASAEGGNLRVSANTTTMKNTILTAGSDSGGYPNCRVLGGATLTSQGKNLEDGTSCAFTAPHLSSTDPQLGSLQNNGGSTDTRLPAVSSLAVDGALDCTGPGSSIDQRNFSRPRGPACDIGAVERRYPAGVADTATVNEDTPTAIDVLTNDTDPDTTGKTITGVSDPANGNVSFTATGLTYTPDPDYCNGPTGTDDFTYTLNGGSQGNVAVTVTCLDEASPAQGGSPSSSGGTGPGSGSGTPGIVDAVPAVSGASAENPRFRVDPGGEAAQRRGAPKGTAFRFRLSEAASVAITIQQRLRGRRAGKRCVKQTRANRKKKRCNLLKSLRTFTKQGAAGQNRVPFSGRIRVGGRARNLKPGSYQASLVATDAGGKRSPAQVVRFRVVK
jgi:Bacterial Ig domain